jgi:oligopeptide/dipeptide ABC transporter ATP-binding protein
MSEPGRGAVSAPRALLEVDRLSAVVRGPGRDVPVVRDVSFTVRPGETLGIVGETGSGKTLTALSVMGLLPDGVRVSGGAVRLGGRDLLVLPERERRQVRGAELAMVYQDPMTALNPLMRLGEQVEEGLRAHGADREQARRRTIEAFAEVGLPSPERVARAWPHQLSGGMRQRAMIAVALANRPRLLIADEPTTALDVTVQQQILALVDRLRAETGLAVVWITHDLGVVARIAHQVLVMYAGRAVEVGPAAELFARPEHPYTAGLLASIPPARGRERPPLRQIGGTPPDPAALPLGCPFHPRCRQRAERCVAEDPPLTARARDADAAADGRRPVAVGAAACWVPPERWAW